MSDLDLRAVMARYSRALDAKPGKGGITADGIAAITDSVADVPQLLAEVERLTEQNTRYATRLATYRQSMQEQMDPMFQAVARVQALVSDWQANGNSRELGDPTADVWQACARQLLDALNSELATSGPGSAPGASGSPSREESGTPTPDRGCADGCLSRTAECWCGGEDRG